jgi:hypothetical protein
VQIADGQEPRPGAGRVSQGGSASRANRAPLTFFAIA